MLIAKIENGAVVDIADHRQFFFDMGPTPDIDYIKANGFMLVLNNKSLDHRYEKLVAVEPYIKDDYVHTVDVVPKTPEDLEHDKRIKAAEMRRERNNILRECDWTQLPDSTADKEAWLTFRQALRDITTQPGFPWEISWPKAPGYLVTYGQRLTSDMMANTAPSNN